MVILCQLKEKHGSVNGDGEILMDRRAHNRFKAKKGAFAWINSNRRRSFRIKTMSMGEIAFAVFKSSLMLILWLPLSIFEKGRTITIAGIVQEKDMSPWKESNYSYPMILVREIHPWPGKDKDSAYNRYYYWAPWTLP